MKKTNFVETFKTNNMKNRISTLVAWIGEVKRKQYKNDNH
jgi:hypothetical protein